MFFRNWLYAGLIKIFQIASQEGHCIAVNYDSCFGGVDPIVFGLAFILTLVEALLWQ